MYIILLVCMCVHVHVRVRVCVYTSVYACFRECVDDIVNTLIQSLACPQHVHLSFLVNWIIFSIAPGKCDDNVSAHVYFI